MANHPTVPGEGNVRRSAPPVTTKASRGGCAHPVVGCCLLPSGSQAPPRRRRGGCWLPSVVGDIVGGCWLPYGELAPLRGRPLRGLPHRPRRCGLHTVRDVCMLPTVRDFVGGCWLPYGELAPLRGRLLRGLPHRPRRCWRWSTPHRPRRPSSATAQPKASRQRRQRPRRRRRRSRKRRRQRRQRRWRQRGSRSPEKRIDIMVRRVHFARRVQRIDIMPGECISWPGERRSSRSKRSGATATRSPPAQLRTIHRVPWGRVMQLLLATRLHCPLLCPLRMLHVRGCQSRNGHRSRSGSVSDFCEWLRLLHPQQKIGQHI